MHGRGQEGLLLLSLLYLRPAIPAPARSGLPGMAEAWACSCPQSLEEVLGLLMQHRVLCSLRLGIGRSSRLLCCETMVGHCGSRLGQGLLPAGLPRGLSLYKAVPVSGVGLCAVFVLH
jgi:hypothetical protein